LLAVLQRLPWLCQANKALDPFPFTITPTMAEILSLNAYYLSFPTDAYNSDVVAVQLKSYKQKDAYFTVAVFKDYVTAREFVLEFPTIPGSILCFLWNLSIVWEALIGGLISHERLKSAWVYLSLCFLSSACGMWLTSCLRVSLLLKYVV